MRSGRVKVSAKKISAISILTALVLIASFTSAILPQAISPKPVQAATVVTFTTVGTTTWTAPANVTSIDVLVVAGGGGGGGISNTNAAGGGGGGAGGFRSISSYVVTPNQSYTVVVGAGGTAGVDGVKGGSGGNSSFATITANGGGGGASTGAANNNGVAGGSGGGGRRDGTALGGAGNTPATSPSQGNRGGNGSASNFGSGGGGGASAVGANGNGQNGGAGGAGTSSSISGSPVTYAGGGGGGGWGAAGGAGGVGGGGSAPATRGAGTPGTNGRGGGGGGATGSNSGNAFSGGAGGSGIVIIWYAAPEPSVIGTVALWTTGAGPAATTSITPQSELNIKIPVSDNNSFSDLFTLKATLYYDADGTFNVAEVPAAGNTQTCAILTWTKATNILTIDSGGSITWSVINSSSVFPSLSNRSGTFEFHFTAGKVATQTIAPAKWHIYVVATDSYPYTGNGTLQNLSMTWYGEIIVNTPNVDWGNVTAGMDFNDSAPSRQSNISMTYICNGAYNAQVKSATTWTGSEASNAILKPEGNPGPNQFSLRADYDNTWNGSVLVPAVYATFRSGTQTGEGGYTELANSLWLKLGTPFVTGQYNGSIYYKIASP
jgi:hypothetical protein